MFIDRFIVQYNNAHLDKTQLLMFRQFYSMQCFPTFIIICVFLKTYKTHTKYYIFVAENGESNQITLVVHNLMLELILSQETLLCKLSYNKIVANKSIWNIIQYFVFTQRSPSPFHFPTSSTIWQHIVFLWAIFPTRRSHFITIHKMQQSKKIVDW